MAPALAPPQEDGNIANEQMASSTDTQHTDPKVNEINMSSYDFEIPVIDLQGSHGERRSLVVQQIRRACMEWGGFQIINHGVSPSLMKRMHHVASEFFNLPTEEKWKFSSSIRTNTIDLFYGYGTKEYGSKGALDWGDQLRHKTLPVSTRAYEQWPTNPSSFRETEEEYIQEQDKLIKHLFELISEGLGLGQSFFNDLFGEDHQQILLVNHYPPPEGNPTLSLQRHSDFSTLAILMQDVSGLQFERKDGDWTTVEAIQDAFVINLGDQMEILTNGLYKSPVHRAWSNSSKERFCIGAFSCPPDYQVMAPISKLLVDSQQLPRYRARTYAEYRTEIMSIAYMDKTLVPDL